MENKIKTCARRYALQFLYSKGSAFLNSPSLRDVEREINEFNEFYKSLELNGNEVVFFFGKTLILDLIKNHCGIREKLKSLCVRKNFEKLSRIEKSLLMMGGVEILCRKDVPDIVAINEYINLSKEFGNEKTSAFVNGVLDGLAKTTMR